MKTLGTAALAAVLLAAFASPSQAQNIVVWRAIIGIAQASNVVCGPGSASPTVIDTPLVPLDAQGNAEFSGSFSSSTAGCSAMDVAFLVRTAAGAWIGNGSVRVP